MSDSPFPPGAQAALYLRDSGGAEQELSLEQQESALRAWATAHQVQVGAVFCDSTSGTSTRGRAAFLEMLKHFQQDPPEQGILIWRSNRFGRNIDDTQFYKADLRRRGYLVHSITDNIPEGPMGRLIEFALDWKDQLYSEQMGEDIQRGLRALVLEHRAVPGPVPFGMRRVPLRLGTRRNGAPHIVHRWEPDPEQADIVRRAYELRAQGASLFSITRALPHISARLTRFFSNPIYKGSLHFSDLVIEDYCPPIVSPQLWEAARQVGLARRHSRQQISQARRVSSSYLLSGLVHCQACGHLMSGHTVKKYHYYACSSAGCNEREIPAERLEAEVIRVLLEKVLTIENLIQVHAELQTQVESILAESQSNRTELTQRLAAATRAIDHLTDDLKQYGSSESVSKSLRESEAEAASLHRQLDTLDRSLPSPESLTQSTLAEDAAEIRSILTTGSLDEKRHYLKLIIENILVIRNEQGLIGKLFYYPLDLGQRSADPSGSVM